MLVLWRILCKCWSLRERKESEVYSPGLIFLPASGRTLQTDPCDARHILRVGMCLSMFLSVLICACAWWDPHMVFSKVTLRTCSSFISVTATKYLNQKQCWRRKWCLISNSKTQPILRGVRVRTQDRNLTAGQLAISYSHTSDRGTYFSKRHIRNHGWWCLGAC